MVDDINDLQQVDAVFLVGDLTDFGLIREFGWLNESLLRLQCPFIAVIGNHDCLANGTELFERTYGPLNQHFDWAGIRFVLHNTNSREFSFNGQVPDINWMRSAVEDTSAYRASIFVSHIKPFDIGDFDAALEDAYVQVLRSARSPLFSVHGHDHISNSVTPYGSDLHFHVAGSPSYSSYALVKIFTLDDGTISYTLSRRTFLVFGLSRTHPTRPRACVGFRWMRMLNSPAGKDCGLAESWQLETSGSVFRSALGHTPPAYGNILR